MPWYSEKIGPLPAGVWLGVVVVGVGGGLLWERRQSSAGPTVSTAADTGTGDVQAPLQASGYGTLIPATTTIVPAQAVTNEEWVQTALDAMAVADPVFDPSAAEEALMAYIRGSLLTPAQLAYVTLARALVGNPPIPIVQVTPIPTPQPPVPPKPGPKPPPRQQWVTTGKYGTRAGHPVDYAWLSGAGYITWSLSQKRWMFTGKGHLPKGHPVDYAYMESIGLIRKA